MLIPLWVALTLVLTRLNGAPATPLDTATANDSPPPRSSDTLHVHPAGYSIQGDLYEYYSDIFTLGLSEQQQRAKHPGAVRVLFIGNSWTGTSGMPEMFHDLMVSTHHPCVVGMITQGGADLSDLWNDSVPKWAIHDFPWDYVVLQERSVGDSVNFFAYAGKFLHEITAKHAKPVLFPQYVGNSQSRFAQDNIDAENAALGRALHVPVIPVSTGWDAAMAADPSLVNDLQQEDHFHPTSHGAYLNALLVYRMITGHSPIGLPAQAGQQPMPMSAQLATLLQHAAAMPVASRIPQGPIHTDADTAPHLTVDILARLAAFYTRFLREPDSILQAGRETIRMHLTWSLGPQRISLDQADMVAMASQFPSVASDLQQADLTAQQVEADRLAFFSACLPLRWVGLGSRPLVALLPETSVLKQNMKFLAAHPNEFQAVQAAGLVCRRH